MNGFPSGTRTKRFVSRLGMSNPDTEDRLSTPEGAMPAPKAEMCKRGEGGGTGPGVCKLLPPEAVRWKSNTQWFRFSALEPLLKAKGEW